MQFCNSLLRSLQLRKKYILSATERVQETLRGYRNGNNFGSFSYLSSLPREDSSRLNWVADLRAPLMNLLNQCYINVQLNAHMNTVVNDGTWSADSSLVGLHMSVWNTQWRPFQTALASFTHIDKLVVVWNMTFILHNFHHKNLYYANNDGIRPICSTSYSVSLIICLSFCVSVSVSLGLSTL